MDEANDAMRLLCAAQKADNFAWLSPGCAAHQMLLEAALYGKLAWRVSKKEVGQQCVRGLMACELALALDPSKWYEVGSSHMFRFLAGDPHGHWDVLVRWICKQQVYMMTMCMLLLAYACLLFALSSKELLAAPARPPPPGPPPPPPPPGFPAPPRLPCPAPPCPALVCPALPCPALLTQSHLDQIWLTQHVFIKLCEVQFNHGVRISVMLQGV